MPKAHGIVLWDLRGVRVGTVVDVIVDGIMQHQAGRLAQNARRDIRTRLSAKTLLLAHSVLQVNTGPTRYRLRTIVSRVGQERGQVQLVRPLAVRVISVARVDTAQQRGPLLVAHVYFAHPGHGRDLGHLHVLNA